MTAPLRDDPVTLALREPHRLLRAPSGNEFRSLVDVGVAEGRSASKTCSFIAGQPIIRSQAVAAIA